MVVKSSTLLPKLQNLRSIYALRDQSLRIIGIEFHAGQLLTMVFCDMAMDHQDPPAGY